MLCRQGGTYSVHRNQTSTSYSSLRYILRLTRRTQPLIDCPGPPFFKDTDCLPISTLVLPHARRGFSFSSSASAITYELCFPHKLPLIAPASSTLSTPVGSARPTDDIPPQTLLQVHPSYIIFLGFWTIRQLQRRLSFSQLESESFITRVMDHPTT